jgi:hypothetical protein
MIKHAKHYLNAGLSILPAKRQQKYPALSQWKPYQLRLPTLTEIDAWFSNPQDGLCIVAGAVSGTLEMIDFDNGGELFDAWYQQIDTELVRRLVIEQSPSGGWHVVYRCQTPVSGSMKLAERKDSTKIHTLIETRGEGGLFLCAPTAGYELMQGAFDSIPILTTQQRESLLQAAWALNEYFPEPVNVVSASSGPSSALRPGDDYNARGDVRALLQSHGWQCVKGGENEYWRRPDKTTGWSATLKNNVFYVWSSNASPFEPKKPYAPFSVYTILEHGGDFGKAAAELVKQGYGQALTDSFEDVDVSGLLKSAVLPASEEEEDDKPVSLTKLIAEFQGLNPPIIHGLLREGETMNIIASPKVGKSWLVDLLVISLTSGLDWLKFKVEPGDVLLIDNELHSNTTTYRIMQVAEAMKVPTALFSDHVQVQSLRGKLKDMHRLAKTFDQIQPNQYKVIVIDAFYRTLPVGVDENDNGAIANLYNLLDCYASRLRCAFVLIHHASKGNQANKAVTDVGSGAGSQSRAVDAHLVIRPHQDKDTFVVDAAVRSWAPIEPFVIRKQHPLFVVDPKADPEDLQGTEKKRDPKNAPTLEEFVDACVGCQDPCSLRLIEYQAEQVYGLSVRKAKDLIDMALDKQLVCKIKAGSTMKYVKHRTGYSGDKGQWVAALLANKSSMSPEEIAHITGASERYIRMVKSGNDAEMAGNDFRFISALSPENQST